MAISIELVQPNPHFYGVMELQNRWRTRAIFILDFTMSGYQRKHQDVLLAPFISSFPFLSFRKGPIKIGL